MIIEIQKLVKRQLPQYYCLNKTFSTDPYVVTDNNSAEDSNSVGLIIVTTRSKVYYAHIDCSESQGGYPLNSTFERSVHRRINLSFFSIRMHQ